MIYNRWGDSLKLLHQVQQFKPIGFVTPVTPVWTFCETTDQQRWYFAETLRADNGLLEITEALKELPAIEVSQSDLRRIIKEAL